MDVQREEALRLAKGVEATASALQRVGKATSPDAARWAFSQWDLRQRGRAKFSRADEMLFVREALEQATHERVAAYHASLFPVRELVADLTAGIGADLIALAARGPVVGFELDPERAEFARHNLSAYGREGEVRVEDSLAWLESGPELGFAFVDPARRVEGRRTRRLEEFSPDPLRLAEAFGRLELGVMKLSPMLSDEEISSLGRRIEFVSFGGECREVLAFGGREIEERASAVHVESGERLDASPLGPSVEAAQGFLYDCDPAAIRVHALGALYQKHGLKPLGISNGYLTGDSEITSPWMRGYRVLYDGKADPKTTKKALKELDAATPELKQRGAGLDLDDLRRTYAMSGGRRVSLAIWPVGRSLRHTILERLDYR